MIVVCHWAGTWQSQEGNIAESVIDPYSAVELGNLRALNMRTVDSKSSQMEEV